MSTRAEELAEKAERLKQKAAEREAAAKKATAEPSPATSDAEVIEISRGDRPAPVDNPHVTPIRSTVDLPPVQHRKLKAWCGETADMLGKSRITTQDVIRALITRMLDDDVTARKIRDDLRKKLRQ